jgi:hypothetical protein
VIAADSCSPEQRIALGSYVLGALDPAEADQVRAHLVECATCRAEYRELTAVPAILARIPETEMAAEPVYPGDEMLARLLERASPRASGGVAAGRSRARRHRGAARQSPKTIAYLWSGSWRRRLSIAAAGCALATAAAIGVYAAAGSNSPAVFSRTVQASNPAMHISGEIHYHATAWGSWVEVTMHNVPPGDDCTLLAVDAKGNRVVASTWWAPSGGTATIPGGVAMEAASISRFEVVTADGSTLLDVPAG